MKNRFVLMEEEPGAGGAPAGEPPAGEPAGTPPAEPAGAWNETLPDTWRGDMVKSLGLEDSALVDKRSAQLERVPDFKTLTKNYFESQDKIREGIKPQGLAENATEEQIIEYREANNVPATSEEYAKGLDEGMVFGEMDERIFGAAYEVAHKHNIPSNVMNDLTNAVMSGRQAEEDQLLTQDGLDQQNFESMAREQWGGDYQTNINLAKNWLNMLPESVRDEVANARLSNGKALFNSPEFMTQIVANARVLNPAATVVPNSNNPTQAISDEIKKIEGMMGTDEYDKDPQMQQRLRDLYDADAGMKKSA